MGVDTKGILIGSQSAESIAAIIRNHGNGIGQDVEVEHLGRLYPDSEVSTASARIFFRDPKSETRRTMYVFWNIGDDRDVYDGERTHISLGASGSAVPVIEDVVSHFGGFMCESDSREDWRAVDLRPGAEIVLSPLDRLSIDVGQAFGSKDAEVLRKVAADPDKLAAVMEAFDRYRSSLDADNAPGIGGGR